VVNGLVEETSKLPTMIAQSIPVGFDWLPASNKRTKRVDGNKAIIYPKQPETCTVALFLIIPSMKKS